MWRNLYFTLGPLRGAWCIDPKGWPWAIFVVWRTAPHRQTVLIDWQILGSIYLAIGVAAGFVVTSREAIDYYRSIPSIRRDEEQVGPFLFGMSLLIAAMLMVIAWPVAFMGNDDGE